MTIQDLSRLAGLVFVSVTLIVIGDTCGKLLGQRGVDPAFIAFSRFFIGALVILPISGIRMHEIKGLLNWRIILRGALIAGGILSILTALKTEPIANVFGAFFIGPVVAYVLAIFLLGERPTLGRSLLLALGFGGVMLVVRPGFDMSPGIGFALLAGTFYGCFLVATRVVANEARPRLLLLSQLVVGSVLLAPLGASIPLPEGSAALYLLILGSALGSASGNYLLVVVNRRAEASLIAPLIYTQLISATAVGLWVFGDAPDPVAMLGLILILLSGIGSLWLRWRSA
ncbi:DMT family transporter [Cognatishimia sp. D5M38]|uniref:DMT family transporter n=1 Tax=Cognatishimia coralii TaxID=3083254 RepID=A0ABU8QJQ2_9RHOB